MSETELQRAPTGHENRIPDSFSLVPKNAENSLKLDQESKEDLPVLRGVSLQRKTEGVFVKQLLVVLLLTVDVGKSVFSYALLYHNGDRYPIPQTEMVTAVEALKFLTVTIIHLVMTKSISNLRPSLIFMFPSLIYAITSNIFLYALTFITPAVWIVLIQSKVVFTLIIYRLVFRKIVTSSQWVAAVLFILAIAISQIRSLTMEGTPAPLMAILLSFVNSILASVVSVYTEVLFKNDSRSFWEQQIQLYCFGTVLNLIYVLLTGNLRAVASSFVSWSNITKSLLVLTVVTTAAQGITMAVVMRQLDNVVKFYTAALANIMTAIASACLFPDKFVLDITFIFSLLILIFAIYLYENKNFNLFCPEATDNEQ
ncbi:CMP-sialic acid transporter 1-like [Limulus polyphemus]|uniref:CMP-sialic acid transporter 1-like n=1 Tax=Limulus polyphemus TaxID=6850 RepID=A0ABM1BMA8_LIMPO|nr:CMP-sialic acid transporter 1-like [Limulus polyphemus]